MGQLVKNLSAIQEIACRRPEFDPGFNPREDPLEREMATHTSNLASETLWTKEPGRLTVHGVTRVRHELVTKLPSPLYTVSLMLQNIYVPFPPPLNSSVEILILFMDGISDL